MDELDHVTEFRIVTSLRGGGIQLLNACTETLTRSKSGCIGAGNSASSLVVGIHIDKRPFVTSVREANVRMSFCIASNPYGFLGAMYPGRLDQVNVWLAPLNNKK